MLEKYILKLEELKPCDIVFTADKKSITSKPIRVITKAEYSHAIVYIGDGSYIDATTKYGVQSGTITRQLKLKKEHLAVYRYKRPLAQDEAYRVEEYARLMVAAQYSLTGAPQAVEGAPPALARVAQAVIDFFDDGEGVYCSKLVASAYQYAGIPIVDEPDCTPKDIYSSSQLQVVPNCVRKARDEEIAFFKTHDPLKDRCKAMRYILKELSKASGQRIANFSSVIQCVELHPEVDTDLCDIIKKSGYLDLFLYELNKNKFRYSRSEFIKFCDDRRIPYSALADEEVVRALNSWRRFSVELENHFILEQQHPYDFIKLFVDLYLRLTKSTKVWADTCVQYTTNPNRLFCSKILHDKSYSNAFFRENPFFKF